jgi:hypothetical protein
MKFTIGGYVDLSHLNHLRSFHANVYHVDAVCDTLASVHRSAPLEHVVINAIPWPFEKHHEHRVSNLSDHLWTRMNEVLEGQNLLRVVLLEVGIPTDYGEEALSVVRKCMTDLASGRRVLKLGLL